MPTTEKPKPEEILGQALFALVKLVFALTFGLVAVLYKAHVLGWYWEWFFLNPYLPKPSVFTLMAAIYIVSFLVWRGPTRDETEEEKELKHDNTWLFVFSLTMTSLYWGLGYVITLIRANYGG